jgi:hypothetical protein
MKRLIPLLFLTVIVTASSCKKKDDVRAKVYRTWLITNMEGTGMDEVAKAELNKQENTVEFTKKGKMIMMMGGAKTEGSFELNEAATSMTTRANGKTETYSVSGLSESSMTLSDGDLTMSLTAKK